VIADKMQILARGKGAQAAPSEGYEGGPAFPDGDDEDVPF
jgi:hypothetical protein